MEAHLNPQHAYSVLGLIVVGQREVVPRLIRVLRRTGCASGGVGSTGVVAEVEDTGSLVPVVKGWDWGRLFGLVERTGSERRTTVD